MSPLGSSTCRTCHLLRLYAGLCTWSACSSCFCSSSKCDFRCCVRPMLWTHVETRPTSMPSYLLSSAPLSHIHCRRRTYCNARAGRQFDAHRKKRPLLKRKAKAPCYLTIMPLLVSAGQDMSGSACETIGAVVDPGGGAKGSAGPLRVNKGLSRV
jgi:hypothetical protein